MRINLWNSGLIIVFTHLGWYLPPACSLSDYLSVPSCAVRSAYIFAETLVLHGNFDQLVVLFARRIRIEKHAFWILEILVKGFV